MKNLSKSYLIVTTVAFVTVAGILAHYAHGQGSNSNATLCTWGAASKTFTKTANTISITGYQPHPATVTFTTSLSWQQKSYVKADGSTYICELKDPVFSAAPEGYGGECVIPLTHTASGAVYTFYFEIQYFAATDFMAIDTSSINGASYGTVVGARAAASSAGAGRTANWTWYPVPKSEPLSVSITGASGRKIEIQHVSQGVFLRKVRNSAGDPIEVGFYQANNFDMNHVIEATP